MERAMTNSLWQVWVCPERKIVSFHAAAGFQMLEFRSRELFLQCVDRYAGEPYRYQ